MAAALSTQVSHSSQNKIKPADLKVNLRVCADFFQKDPIYLLGDKKIFKPQFIKKWHPKSQFLWCPSPTYKKSTHFLRSHSRLPWGFILSQIEKKQQKTMCPINDVQSPFSLHFKSHYKALSLEPKMVQQEGQSSCTNSLHSPLCHVSVFVTIYCSLCHTNYAMTTEWNEQEEIRIPPKSVIIPMQCNYARTNVETLHVGCWLEFLSHFCINIPNALLHIQREPV